MPITYSGYDSDPDTEDCFVVFSRNSILTTVTSTASVVERWVSDIYRLHHHRLHWLIVGLDCEWLPTSNGQHKRSPVATLQLCVGLRCLIFQLVHADFIPKSLAGFLSEPDFTFVGVGVKDDAQKLMDDGELSVGRTLDLRTIAAEKLTMKELKQAGLKRLAAVVLGVDVDKPILITMSEWDKKKLASGQVNYACIDAFVSFEIGKNLINRH